MKTTKKEKIIFIISLSFIGYIFFSLQTKEFKVNSLTTKSEYNSTKILTINNQDYSYNKNLYIKNSDNKDIIGNCYVIGNDYLFTTNYKLIDTDVVFKCDNNRTINKEFLKEVGMSVIEARKKHNISMTREIKWKEWYVHFFSDKIGFTTSMIMFFLSFIAFLIFKRPIVFFYGMIISVLTGAIVGLYFIYYPLDLKEKFYKDIEKETGEKIIRNHHFF